MRRLDWCSIEVCINLVSGSIPDKGVQVRGFNKTFDDIVE